MCIKRFGDVSCAHRMPDNRPSPPLIYEVVAVRVLRLPNGMEQTYLGLRQFRGDFWRHDYFRRCEPLPPETEDLDVREPVLA